MTESNSAKKTILYDTHIKLGAKMAPFGGFDMPIQYDGIIKEHHATRNEAVLFDTCHMGEYRITGETATKDLEYILSCRVDDLRDGQCRYGFICNEDGGVLDDQIIYKISSTEYYMVVNAGTQISDFEWIKSHLSEGTTIVNESNNTAKIDVQGPLAPKIVEKLVDDPIIDLKFYTFKLSKFNGTEIIVSRTGYTGEIGLEIYCPNDIAEEFWNACSAEGAKPAGLGCRDTLRLEMGFPLYGHELDEETNPLQTGFARAIDNDKEFIGSKSIFAPDNAPDRLVGLVLEGRRAARHGDKILNNDNEEIGRVTSGSFSPSLEQAIAFAYVKKEYAEIGTEMKLDTGRKQLPAKITESPFHKKGTCRKAIKRFL